MKILIAIDSFKGSLTSEEAGQAAQIAIQQTRPNIESEIIPIADGGEGMLSIMQKAIGGTMHTLLVHNPLMEITPASYGISSDRNTAFIEMASASGLTLIPEEKRDPLKTTTYGTGELIRDALENGCTEIIIGIGGSATNDAGIGMLQALGYRFLDKQGNALGQGGEMMGEVAHIDISRKHRKLKNAHFIVACDVQNPFYGPNGAAFVFAPQKGATPEMVYLLDQGLRSFSQIIFKETGKDITNLPGSGAAGGLGGSLSAFLNADLQSGADLLLGFSQFERKLENTQLILTGEGKIDRQSLMGKITGKILQIGKEKHIPVIAIAGCVEDQEELSRAGFKEIHQIKPGSMPLEKAMEPGIAMQNIQRTVSHLITKWISSD